MRAVSADETKAAGYWMAPFPQLYRFRNATLLMQGGVFLSRIVVQVYC